MEYLTKDQIIAFSVALASEMVMIGLNVVYFFTRAPWIAGVCQMFGAVVVASLIVSVIDVFST